MILANVSFGIFAFLPQGWLFMLFIILIESLTISKILSERWINWPVYLRVLISNVLSGLVGFLASMKLNGGWWLVVWFPWVSDNEVRTDDFAQLFLLYGIAFVLTLLIEIPTNKWLLKSFPTKQIIISSLAANVISYALGTLILYSYSFGLIGRTESNELDSQKEDFKKFTELLNQSKTTVEKSLKENYYVNSLEIDVKNKDSVRLLFETNTSERFTFFIVNDTLKYFAQTNNFSSNVQLLLALSNQFSVDSLASLRGEILENYNTSERKAVQLFKDLENNIGYLVVDYKEDSGRYAKMIVWKLKE